MIPAVFPDHFHGYFEILLSPLFEGRAFIPRVMDSVYLRPGSYLLSPQSQDRPRGLWNWLKSTWTV